MSPTSYLPIRLPNFVGPINFPSHYLHLLGEQKWLPKIPFDFFLPQRLGSTRRCMPLLQGAPLGSRRRSSPGNHRRIGPPPMCCFFLGPPPPSSPISGETSHHYLRRATHPRLSRPRCITAPFSPWLWGSRATPAVLPAFPCADARCAPPLSLPRCMTHPSPPRHGRVRLWQRDKEEEGRGWHMGPHVILC
jgi:hypothetical protein